MNVHLNKSEFEDCFCVLCNDTDKFFDLLKTKDVKTESEFVDIFESLGAFIMFCNDDFKLKI